MAVRLFTTSTSRQLAFYVVIFALAVVLITVPILYYFNLGNNLGNFGFLAFLGEEDGFGISFGFGSEVKLSKSLQVLSNKLGIPVGGTGANLTTAQERILHHYLRTHVLIPPFLTDSEPPPPTYTHAGHHAGKWDKLLDQDFQEATRPLEQKLKELIAGQKSGYYVEARARHGHNFHSFTRSVLEEELGWTGLLIEGVPELVENLRAQKRKAWIAKACLSKNSTEYAEYSWLNDNPSGGGLVAKPSLKLIPPTKRELSRKIDGEPNRIIECFPLTHILGAMSSESDRNWQNRARTIDVLILTLDGDEYKILNHIPQTIPIKIIVVQHWLVPEGRDAFKGLMYARRYYLTFESDSYYIFIKMKHLLGPILAE